MISILIFIMYNTALKIMSAISRLRIETKQARLEALFGINLRIFYFIVICVISVSLIQNSYAQTINEQVTLSGDLHNNPVAQDILKKIENGDMNNSDIFDFLTGSWNRFFFKLSLFPTPISETMWQVYKKFKTNDKEQLKAIIQELIDECG